MTDEQFNELKNSLAVMDHRVRVVNRCVFFTWTLVLFSTVVRMMGK